MENNKEYDILEKDEELEAENRSGKIIYDLSSYGIDFPVSAYMERYYDDKTIYLPEFQRNYVWTKKQASKFVESLLLGLPVPGIFLYKEDNNKMLIIDGFQRLESLSRFIKDQEFDSKVFKLDVESRFDGKSYDSLDDDAKLKLRNAVIHATIIKAENPQSDNYPAVYEIFERLNTGGSKLSPQEVRNCVSHGELREALLKLSKTRDIKNLLKISDKRKKDEEIILRLIALTQKNQEYQGNMKQFLNTFMFLNRNLEDNRIKETVNNFIEIVKFINNLNIDDVFRPKEQLSIATLDAVWVGICKNYKFLQNIPSDKIREKIKELLSNDDFKESIKTGTTHNKESVRTRINLAIEFLSK